MQNCVYFLNPAQQKGTILLRNEHLRNAAVTARVDRGRTAPQG